MSGLRPGWLLPALGGIAVAAAAPAPKVTVSELAHCAAIVAVDQRLACYDSLAAAKLQTAATPAAAPGAAVTAAAAAPAAAGGFGMSTHAPPTEQATQLISAQVVTATADRQGNVFAVLDNGQTWTYLDASGPPQPGGAVTIRRAALGSYLLTTPSHHTFRAQRSQ